MSSNQLIVWMLIACLAFAGLLFFSKPAKAVARTAVQGLIGAALMFVVNFAFAPLGLYVGINLLTAFICGVLGLPGLVTLYILQVML